MGLSPKAREFFVEAGKQGQKRLTEKYGKDYHKKIRLGISGKNLHKPLVDNSEKI